MSSLNEKQIELQTSLRTKNLQGAFEALDGDLNKQIHVDRDSFKLMQYVGGGDGLIDRAEFLAYFEQSFYQLVLEDVLTRPFTKVNATENSVIDELFPGENSTLNEEDIRDLLMKFDLDGDKYVTRTEMVKLFQANKAWAIKSFAERIDLVQRNLNLQTRQPLEVRDFPYDYYYSSGGQVLDYESAQSFCGNWGGVLTAFSSEKEYEKVFEFYSAAKSEFWYGDLPEFNYQIETLPGNESCKVLELDITYLKYTKCNQKR